MRVIAVDPALRNTGYAVLEGDGRKARALDLGVVSNPASATPSGCLVEIHRAIADLIRRHAPDCAAVEGVIYVQSHRTAITLGCARGAALLALAQAGLPIHEYAPRRVKQAVVGRGGADKAQVAFMVRALLELDTTPAPDAADALAVGLTHLQTAASAHPALRGARPRGRI